jgi:hypothetical protein
MPEIDHWGKIACHFPDRGNPNLDVMDIKFLANGASSLSHIDRVYMLPPGVTVSTVEDLQKYIVWTTDLTLQQLGDPITIEYVPPDDMNLTDIAIFTTDNEPSQSINFAIYHESGLVVAKSNGDTSTSTTFFGTSGYRRNTTVSGVTLKKGYKYYIQYTNTNNTFKPAAMDGWVGNYLKWTHGQAQNKNVANINNTTGYLSSVPDIAAFVAVPTGNFFKWTGNTYGTQSDRIYVRNNVGHGVYAGIIGSGSLTLNDMDTILKYAENTMYLWTGYDIDNGDTMVMNNFHVRNNALATSHYKGIVQDRAELLDPIYDIDDYVIRENYSQIYIYKKTDHPSVFDTMDFSEYSAYSNAVQAATLIKKSSPSPSPSGPNGGVMTYGQFYGNSKNGYIYTLKSGKTYDFTLVDNVLTGYTVANPPASYVKDCIYYLEEGGNYNSQYANPGLNLWTGSGWTAIVQYFDNLDVVFDVRTNAVEQYTTEVSRSTPIDIVGDATALVSASYDNTYQSETLPSQQVWTDQKYYLKLNDTEV